MKTLLSVRNLRVEIPTRWATLVAVDDMSFDIDEGEVLGVRQGQHVVGHLGKAAAHGKMALGLHAGGDLAVERAAEVAVPLRTPCGADAQPVSHIPFAVHVPRRAVAGGVHLVRRPEAWKHLRPDGAWPSAIEAAITAA